MTLGDVDAMEVIAIKAQCIRDLKAERDELRAALVSLVNSKSEFDIEYDTGIPADEARKIMDLAYNRK